MLGVLLSLGCSKAPAPKQQDAADERADAAAESKRNPPGPIPDITPPKEYPGLQGAGERVRERCAAADAKGLVELMSPALQRRVVQAAKQAESIEALAKSYGYDGELPGTLDAEAVMTMRLRADDPAENPCWRAKDWSFASKDARVVLFRMPKDLGRALSFVYEEQSWALDNVSNPIAAELMNEPPT
jgi:hypothetical protein